MTELIYSALGCFTKRVISRFQFSFKCQHVVFPLLLYNLELSNSHPFFLKFPYSVILRNYKDKKTLIGIQIILLI